MKQSLKTIIGQQLSNLISSKISISNNAILNTPQDQYLAYSILTSSWGSIHEQKKHPYFFLQVLVVLGKHF